MPIEPQHRTALEAMFRAFAPDKFERWCSLLSVSAPRWDKISPIDVWPLESAFDSRPNLPMARMLSLPPLVTHLNSNVLVLRCGHSHNPGLSEMMLRDVFPDGRLDYDILFEGFVSIVPGKLALGLNHEGGACVFEKVTVRR
jgi:hypothetical protein